MGKPPKILFGKETCLFCDKVSFHLPRFIQHVATHTMENSYICPKCPEEFRTPYQFSRHMTTFHSKPLKYCCVFCGRKYLAKQCLDRHLYSHTKERWYECINCSSQFPTAGCLRRHKTKCKSDTFKCNICSEKFLTLFTLTAHINAHSVKCSVCHFECKSKYGLKSHMESVHAQGLRFKCNQCPIVCASQFAFDTHMRKHTGERPFACDKCAKRFTRRNLLRHHIASHNDSNLKNWICKECGKQSYSHADLLKHMNTHTKPYSCDLCSERFSKMSILRTHIFSHTGERPYKCVPCSKAYRTQSWLTHHQNTFHGQQQAKHQCKVCKKFFHRKCELRIHLKRHRNQRLHSCLFCERTFITITQARNHLLHHINEAPYICSTCGMEHKTPKQQHHHNLREHTGDKPFACEKCPKRFMRICTLKKHMATHDLSSVVDLLCSLCEKQFYSKHDLLKHVDTHIKPYKCELCEESFSSINILETHILSHTGERPFKCGHCCKTYRTLAFLKFHQNSVHGLQPGKFQCKICTRIFHQKCTLRIHLRRHKNQRFYECLFCNQSFVTITAARNHIRLHTNEAPFICKSTACGREFKTRQQLNQHVCDDVLDLIF